MSDLLNVHDLADRFGCSVNTVRKLRDNGKLPEPLRISERVLRWPETVIDDWLASGCPPADVQCDVLAGDVSGQ